jgi:phosphate/sulfate permease
VVQVFSASAMSFVHGANDVANAMGPLSGVYQIWSTGEISSNVSRQCRCCAAARLMCRRVL